MKNLPIGGLMQENQRARESQSSFLTACFGYCNSGIVVACEIAAVDLANGGSIGHLGRAILIGLCGLSSQPLFLP
jgi:hypothetical protein